MLKNIKKYFTTRKIFTLSIVIGLELIFFFFPITYLYILYFIFYFSEPVRIFAECFLIYYVVFDLCPLLTQIFYQFGRTLRASRSKTIAIVLGCALFGTAQSILNLFSLSISMILPLLLLRFKLVAEVTDLTLSAIKNSFSLNPQAAKQPSGTQLNEGNDRGDESSDESASTTAMPENITDYASYLEGLTRK